MDDHIDMVVGRALRARRRLLGLSQEALAAHAGVQFQQIHKYETGQSRIPAPRLWRLACALSVPVDYFFEGAEAEATGRTGV